MPDGHPTGTRLWGLPTLQSKLEIAAIAQWCWSARSQRCRLCARLQPQRCMASLTLEILQKHNRMCCPNGSSDRSLANKTAKSSKMQSHHDGSLDGSSHIYIYIYIYMYMVPQTRICGWFAGRFVSTSKAFPCTAWRIQWKVAFKGFGSRPYGTVRGSYMSSARQMCKSC